ncbi:MAG: heparinase II/III domain-containing protein [Bacteroidota bacterium]
MIKREFVSSFPEYFNERFFEKQVNPILAADLTPPIFEARKDKFSVVDKTSKKFTLTFLNECRSYQLPINWHEEELEYGTRLWKLNLHYMEFLEEVDNDWFQWIIKDWITQNPPYKKGYWLDSWNSFALSIRVVVWMQQLARRKEKLPDHFVESASESIYKQLLFLEKNIEKDIKGNHLIKNFKALLWGGSFFKDDKNVLRWQSLGKKILNQELKEQILSDGLHYERSPAYHCQVLADLLECHTILEQDFLNGKFKEVINKMGDALVDITHPDGRISLFNDGGLDMAYKPSDLIKNLKKIIGFVPQWSQEIALREAGYYGLRKGDSYLLFDAGEIGPDYLPAHGHGDIFSFEWSLGKHRIFIDKGVFEYNSGKRRQISRSTRSHNTVAVDRQDQCEFWHAFRVARRANVEVLNYSHQDDMLKICAQHNGYSRLRGNPIHRRSVRFDGKELFIQDFIKNGRGQQVEAFFLLSPSVEVISRDKSIVLRAGRREVEFLCNYPVIVKESTWYPNFGVEEPCKKLIVPFGKAPCQFNCSIKVV